MSETLKKGINAGLITSVVIAAIRDVTTNDPTWDIITLPVATAIFLGIVWYINKTK